MSTRTALIFIGLFGFGIQSLHLFKLFSNYSFDKREAKAPVFCVEKKQINKLEIIDNTVKAANELLLSKDPSRVRVLVKQFQSKELIVFQFNHDWPENIEIVYNVVTDSSGIILFIENFFSESDDYRYSYSYYFGNDGKIIFRKMSASFYSTCPDKAISDGVIKMVEKVYFNDELNVIKQDTLLQDLEGMQLSSLDCSINYEFVGHNYIKNNDLPGFTKKK